ncbi:hypothetical protein LEP1GSC127_2575 [Leptospira kirschneri str. 200801925]|nr:hypothetical protein LEP1GSC127_2575 [Leptospira kirschneri str. 200801925]
MLTRKELLTQSAALIAFASGADLLLAKGSDSKSLKKTEKNRIKR